MTLKIDLSPEFEARLKEAALRQGLDETEFAKKILETSVAPPVPVRDQGTLDMLAEWDAEDATDDPEEIARRQAEWQEFKKAMNEDSLSGRTIYP
jgi:hypothetical protein